MLITRSERPRWYTALKKPAIDAYGGKCNRCPETELTRLLIHHVLEDGDLERLLLRNLGYPGTWGFYKWLKELGYPHAPITFKGIYFPFDYEVLCLSCHGRHHGESDVQDYRRSREADQRTEDRGTNIVSEEEHSKPSGGD